MVGYNRKAVLLAVNLGAGGFINTTVVTSRAHLPFLVTQKLYYIFQV
jgi:hypothetical protein